MQNLNLGLISKNRNTVYGIAAFWIMLFHTNLVFEGRLSLISKIMDIGNCGVDIFLFVSGISLYYSFIKGCSLKDFYRHRMQRIILPVLLTTVPWFVFFAPSRKPGIGTFLLNITGLSLFTSGKRTIWFIPMILFCYAIYPLVFSVFKKTNHSIIVLLCLIIVCLAVNAGFRHFTPEFWKKSEIFFRRIPVFIIGSYCGKYVYEKRDLPFSHYQIVVSAVLLTVFFLITNQYWARIIPVRYFYIVLGIICTLCFSVLGNIPLIKHFASWFAPITLELYLCQEKYLKIVSRNFPDCGLVVTNLLAIILAIATAYLLIHIERKVFSK